MKALLLILIGALLISAWFLMPPRYKMQKPMNPLVTMSIFDTDDEDGAHHKIASFEVKDPPQDLISSSITVMPQIAKGVYVVKSELEGGAEVVWLIDKQGLFGFSQEFGYFQFNGKNSVYINKLITQVNDHFVKTRLQSK